MCVIHFKIVQLFVQYTNDQFTQGSSKPIFQSNRRQGCIFDTSKKSTVALLQSTSAVSATGALNALDFLFCKEKTKLDIQ